MKFYAQGRKEGDFEVRHPHGAAGDPGQPALPVPPRGSAGDGARRAELPHHRSRSRDAPVVLHLGRGSGRGAAEGRAARHAAARRRCSTRRSSACWPIRSPKRSSTRFGSQWLRLQDLEKIYPDALLFPYYDYKLGEALKRETELLLRQHRPRGSQHPRPDHRRLHVRERARRAALRHPERQRPGFPARHARRREPPRPARPGQHPGADLGRRSHLAGAARQVDHGSAARLAAAGAAAERAVARRDQGRVPATRSC